MRRGRLTSMIRIKNIFIDKLGQAVGVPVGRRSGGRLAMTLVATINIIITIFFFPFFSPSQPFQAACCLNTWLCPLVVSKFFYPSTPSMRKGCDGGEKNRGKNGGGGIKKIKTFLVATNVIASQPPEHQLTGTPHAHAKIPMSVWPRVLVIKYVKGFLSPQLKIWWAQISTTPSKILN